MARLALWMLSLLTLSALAFAACGDDDGDKGTETESHSRVTTKAPANTVKVNLIEYTVGPDKLSVPAGVTKFVATNTSKSMAHELAVLLVNAEGSFDNTGEIEGLDPGKSGEVVLDLPKGKYVLACLLVPGESGATTDHFKEGMKIDFEVK